MSSTIMEVTNTITFKGITVEIPTELRQKEIVRMMYALEPKCPYNQTDIYSNRTTKGSNIM
jgi:hypothetical protein